MTNIRKICRNIKIFEVVKIMAFLTIKLLRYQKKVRKGTIKIKKIFNKKYKRNKHIDLTIN